MKFKIDEAKKIIMNDISELMYRTQELARIVKIVNEMVFNGVKVPKGIQKDIDYNLEKISKLTIKCKKEYGEK